MYLFVCDDCGIDIPSSKLDEENEAREKKGITLKAHFINCKNTGKHIPGVATRFYHLTEKGAQMFDAVTRFLEEMDAIECQTSGDSTT